MSRQIFSNNLYHFQVAFNMEQQELASELEVSQPRIHNWINGVAYPQVDLMVKICDVFQFRDMYRMVNENIPIAEIRGHAEQVLQATG